MMMGRKKGQFKSPRLFACKWKSRSSYMNNLSLTSIDMLEVILKRGEQLPKEPLFLQWWCTYGKQCPELQRFAIRILSQACDGASRYNLKKGMAEKLLVDGRNRIEQQRLNDLAFVHYNLQLQNKRYGVRNNVVGEEIDAMDDWVVEEAPQETAPENGGHG